MLFMAVYHLSSTPEACCGPSPPDTLSHTGNYKDNSTAGVFHAWRAPTFLYSNVEDSCVAGSYDKGTITTLYCVCIPSHIQHSLSNCDIHLPDTPHPRGHVGLFRRIQRQPFRNPLCVPCNHNLRHPEHLLETAVQRSSCGRSFRNPDSKTRQAQPLVLFLWSCIFDHCANLVLVRRY
jgi:hypothetical protein